MDVDFIETTTIKVHDAESFLPGLNVLELYAISIPMPSLTWNSNAES